MGDQRQRAARRRHGKPNYRITRYADDFVICVAGDRRHAEALIAETERAIRPLGLMLSSEKTRVAHIDEGIDFLGWRIQRHRGSNGRRYVYTYPSKRSLAAVKAKVKAITQTDHQQTLDQLIHRLKPSAERLVRLLSPRGVLADVQLPARLYLAAGRQMAATQTPQDELALAATPLPTLVVADRR
jgi:hypothetical protein